MESLKPVCNTCNQLDDEHEDVRDYRCLKLNVEVFNHLAKGECHPDCPLLSGKVDAAPEGQNVVEPSTTAEGESIDQSDNSAGSDNKPEGDGEKQSEEQPPVEAAQQQPVAQQQQPVVKNGKKK